MKIILLALSFLFVHPALADDPPTYVSDPEPGDYATGYVATPKTYEQFQLEKQFDEESKSKHWSFSFDVTQVGKHPLGYKAPKGHLSENAEQLGEGEDLKPFDIADFGVSLTPVMNQRSCGSCVVFSIIANFMDALKLRGIEHPPLSPQHLMNCGTGGQCNGAYGQQIASDLVTLGTLHAESTYPYTATSGRCQQKDGERFGQIAAYKTIDGSVRSILAALHNGQPVSVGVAVDSRWSSYRSGLYNGCSSMSTNHYVVIQGVDCGTSVDGDGNCVFDAKGNLPPGVGTFNIRNSWGTGWGDGGYMVSQITDKSGRRCNNIAGGTGNAQILDIGVPMPPREPVTFTVENADVVLTVTVEPDAGFSPEEAKRYMQTALKAVGE
jgi:hypothetical protein